MIGRLNHVGIATPSLEAAIALYRDLLGAARFTEPRILEAQGVRLCFCLLDNSEIELLEPWGDASPIRAFLQRHPAGGQHHVAFEVADVDEAAASLAGRGAQILGPPRLGAHGTRVIFVHPRTMGGVLIELMEPPLHPTFEA
jgi:methylmalonyl-CoA/ethylmalonyl-CoA epimerase